MKFLYLYISVYLYILFLIHYLHTQTIIFLNLHFQQIMNSCEFKEIIVSIDFEFENGVLGLDRDCYLSVVKFLDSSVLRKV
jgi:hypothetical protein